MRPTTRAVRARATEPNGAPAGDVVFRSLIKTLGLLRRAMEPFFARFGSRGSQWGELRALHRAQQVGEPMLRLTDLGERLLVRPPSVTGAVNRLRNLGLVSADISDRDQRAKHVRLTPAGLKLVETVLEHHAARVAKVLSVFDEHERQQLHDYLSRLGVHLARLAEEGTDWS
jgi:DNA-binding MarR family transcriptional regulator